MRHTAAYAARMAYLICLLAATASGQTSAASSNGADKIPPPLHSVEKILGDEQQPLTPGSKAIKVVVSLGSSKVVARSSVSWGYHDDQGRFKLSGTKEFDYGGGTLSREIPSDFSTKTVEVKAVIDFTNPEVSDLASKLDEPVTDAGVLISINATAIRCQTFITLLADKKLELRKENYLLLVWQYESADPRQPSVRHSGVIRLSYADLKALRGGSSRSSPTSPSARLSTEAVTNFNHGRLLDWMVQSPSALIVIAA